MKTKVSVTCPWCTHRYTTEVEYGKLLRCEKCGKPTVYKKVKEDKP